MITQNHSLQYYNTFGIAAKADSFATLTKEEQLPQILEQAQGKTIYVLGGGSNIIFSKEVDGLVLLNKLKHITVEQIMHDEVIISVGAGINWHQLVLWSLQQGFGGLENLALIPGTVGAAPIQNIGAYGVELKDVFQSLEAYDLTTGQMRTFSAKDCSFAYRDSFFKQKNNQRKFCLSKIFLKLSSNNHQLKTEYGAIKQTLEQWNITRPRPTDIAAAVINIRRSKLPDWRQLGNAGSFFKNPIITETIVEQLKSKYPKLPSYPMNNGEVKLAAGWLIDQCGWKGKREGSVGCYEKQALVIINHGGATGEDILTFSRKIIDSVMDKFGVKLEREVNVI